MSVNRTFDETAAESAPHGTGGARHLARPCRAPRPATAGTRFRLIALTVLAGGLARATDAGPHPRLLIGPGDVPRLRHACGVGTPPTVARGWGRFGAQRAAYNALRVHFSQLAGDVLLPGELSAVAFLHLIDPDDAEDARRLATVNRALTQPLILTGDVFELVLALDWCWDALDPAARREFLLQVRRSATPLTPADSPLDHRVFRPKLAALALTLAVDEADEPGSSWAALRAQLLDGARGYFATTFPTYVRWRGRIPTGPAAAALEENDTALAVELAGVLAGSSAWDEYSGTVARWMEHYVLAGSPHPALQHQFLRDDGSTAPLTPAARWNAMLPLTAHLIAARAHDPAAASVADRVAAMLADPSAAPTPTPWRWVPAVFDLRQVPRADAARLPPARDLAGAVVLRGSEGAQPAVIWIDSGQPFLRRGQHFDAGHFLIRAGGYLAVAGGDDVEFEATHAKQGVQGLGRERHLGDFSQYFTSSVAHNCLIFWDAARVPRWYGQRYAPAGGQLPREGTCTDFSTPLAAQSRATGELLAYGHGASAAYLALDLARAYDERSVTRYTREFVLLWGRLLIVIDRAVTANPRVLPTWVINVPDRPQVDGAPLAPEARVAGSDNDGGVWRYDHAKRLHWSDRSGSLQLIPLLPEPRRLAIVGGPARPSVIQQGAHRGRTYVGGGPDTFEHLVLPSSQRKAANAWYELGSPTLLGPHFAARRHWGRVEIEPQRQDGQYLFIEALAIGDGHPTGQPQFELRRVDRRIVLSVSLDARRAEITLPSGGETGGELHLETPQETRWAFPTSVMPDDPFPTQPAPEDG